MLDRGTSHSDSNESGLGNERPAQTNDVTLDGHSEQKRQITGVRWFLVVVSILSASGLYALDNTVIADLQPYIVAEFGELEKMTWVSVGTLMGCLATNNIWGKIFGQANTKWSYIVSVIIFEVGSAVCGAAPSMNALIIARVIQGVGGVGIYLGVMTLLSLNTTAQERPTYISMAGMAWGVGTVGGPIIGGAFAVSAVGWRWAFYINLFFAAFQLPIAIFLIPSFDPRPGVPWRHRIKEIDLTGAILMIGITTSIVVAINTGGQIYPWNSGQIIACFVVFCVLLALFAVQQARCTLTTQLTRLFPCQFVVRPVFLNLFVQAGAAAAVSFVAIYYVPIYFQYTRGDSAIQAGVRLLPLVCVLVATQLLSGVLMSKLGYYLPWYIGGGVLALIGSVLMHLVKLDTSAAMIYGYTVLIGAGCGAYQQAGFAVAQVKAKASENADASGFVALGQLTGATLTLAIANSIFLSRSTDGVQALLPDLSTVEVQQIISGGDRAELRERFDSDTRDAVLRTISGAISSAYIVAIVMAALSLALAVLLPFEKIFVPEGEETPPQSLDASHSVTESSVADSTRPKEG